MAVFGTQTAMLSLMDRDRVVVAAARGPFASAGASCPWQWNFCGYSLLSPQPEVLVVGDALVDARRAAPPPPSGPRSRPCAGRARGPFELWLARARPLARSSELRHPQNGLGRPCRRAPVACSPSAPPPRAG